jgi:hypothetical protein
MQEQWMGTDINKGLRRLLSLMTEDEKRQFKKQFKLQGDMKDKDILKAIGCLPKYESLRAFMFVANSTVILLKEIFSHLDLLGVATRTTGCIFTLTNPTNQEKKEEIAFSQQTVNAVCSWPAQETWNREPESLSELITKWKSFRSVWQRLIQNASPKGSAFKIDHVRTVIRGKTVCRPNKNRVDLDAQKVLCHFMIRVEQLADNLTTIPEKNRPEEIQQLLHDIDALKKSVVKCSTGRQRSSQQSPPNQSIINRCTSKRFTSEFDKFLEDVYALSNLIKGNNISDMLQIGVWSTRPQLYEIWVLIKLLKWFRCRGYSISLEKRSKINEKSPFLWNLSYSRDSTPCAVISDPQTSLQQFLFYQLYRPSGDMPDISLLVDSEPTSDAIWSIDPKHSEKGGYSLSQYKETAVGYRDSFKAKLSLVVEYFDRESIGRGANPLVFGDGAMLIKGVHPSGKGVELMFSELEKIHPNIGSKLICVDCSGSFIDKRDLALEKLRQEYQAGAISNIHSEILCFAGNTEEVGAFDIWLNSKHNTFPIPKDLIEGTASAPLIKAISNLVLKVPISEVIIITDSELDIPTQTLTKKIREDLSLTVSFSAT